MLSMFPKFELVPISRYFMTFPKDFRPSTMPAWSTPRLRSRSTMSAASRATSTAVATEIPTSAVWSDGASLIPSPEEADHVPTAPQRLEDAVLLLGATRANTEVRSAT